MKDEKTSLLYYLAIIFVVGCVFGYGIKSYFKGRITSGPDDRKVIVYKSAYDFEAAKKRLDEEMKKAEEEQMKAIEAQQAAGGDSQGIQVVPESPQGCAAPTDGEDASQGCAVPTQ